MAIPVVFVVAWLFWLEWGYRNEIVQPKTTTPSPLQSTVVASGATDLETNEIDTAELELIATAGQEQEILISILSELQELRAGISELDQRLSNSSVFSKTEEGWWNEQPANNSNEVNQVNDGSITSLMRQSPKKSDYASEEEYQQGIRGFQALLDANALADKDNSKHEKQRKKYLKKVKSIVEEDLKGGL